MPANSWAGRGDQDWEEFTYIYSTPRYNSLAQYSRPYTDLQQTCVFLIILKCIEYRRWRRRSLIKVLSYAELLELSKGLFTIITLRNYTRGVTVLQILVTCLDSEGGTTNKRVEATAKYDSRWHFSRNFAFLFYCVLTNGIGDRSSMWCRECPVSFEEFEQSYGSELCFVCPNLGGRKQ